MAKKALGIATVVLAGAGLVALAVRFNDEAGDDRQGASLAQMCGNATAREHPNNSLLNSLCLAAGYGPVTGRTR